DFNSTSVSILLNSSSGSKNSTTTALFSSLNPSVYGQKVTWTATVTTSGLVPPTGRVNFTWDGYSIGTATLNASSVATLTRSNLNADTYPLTAVYLGDANNLHSTSAIVNQMVKETTSVAKITSTPNPSTLGQAVTFIATITSATVMPTGPVTFTSGKTVLGTAQLSGGKAKLPVSSLPVGSTKVTVTYYGDSNIAKSSASVTQTVR
ncbi:MAG TPA: Ig-like domain-containing protein, partial [Candidatus Acidoferrum sp.]|nr:Ig-like domain-containing protein [Candidatus Acidoferrum sp.]